MKKEKVNMKKIYAIKFKTQIMKNGGINEGPDFGVRFRCLTERPDEKEACRELATEFLNLFDVAPNSAKLVWTDITEAKVYYREEDRPGEKLSDSYEIQVKILGIDEVKEEM